MEHGQNQLICHLHSKYVIFLVRMDISLKLNKVEIWNRSEYQKCPLVSCAQLILDLNSTEQGQNQLICHFALKTCHISSQNGYFTETKQGGGLKIGQNIRNVF